MEREEAFVNQPIRSLQAMLREIAFLEPELPVLVPDGVFDEMTLNAVVIFQRSRGLPATGRVDNDTWDAVVLAYFSALPFTAPPRAFNGFPGQQFSVRGGQCCAHMYPVQAMFQALAPPLNGIEPGPVNGSHTGASVRNVTWLQRRSGLPETGTMDQRAWNMLTRLYEIFLTRNPDPALCAQTCAIPPDRSRCLRSFPWETGHG